MPHADSENLIQQVCQHVMRLVEEQLLPDDDMLHCAAASHALNALGIKSSFYGGTIHYNDESLEDIQIAYLWVNNQTRDMQGNLETEDNYLEQLRTAYLIERYGLAPDTVDYASLDVVQDDIAPSRWGDFKKEYEHLASQVLACVQETSMPLPLPRDPPGSIRGGPLSRPRYTTKIKQMIQSADEAGLQKLLSEWAADPDLDRPANLPQTMVHALADHSIFKSGLSSGAIVGLIKQAREYGADIHRVSSREDNLVHTAVQSGQEELVDYLLQEGVVIDLPKLPIDCRMPPLFHAIINDRPNLVRRLIDGGADIHLAGSNGDTPFCAAARTGSDALMDEFIAKGVDIHVQNRFEENVLHMVCETRFESAAMKMQVISKLLDLGVSPDKLNSRKSLPHECLGKGEEALSKFLQYEWAARKLAQETAQASGQRPRRKL